VCTSANSPSRAGLASSALRGRAGAGCSGGFELEPDSEPQLTEVTQGDSDSGSTSESQGLDSDSESERLRATFCPRGIFRFLACAQQAVQTRNVVRSPCTNNQSAPPHVFPSLLPSSAPSTCVVAKQITTLVAVWT
jgi:hypothetical protein